MATEKIDHAREKNLSHDVGAQRVKMHRNNALTKHLEHEQTRLLYSVLRNYNSKEAKGNSRCWNLGQKLNTGRTQCVKQHLRR